MVFTLQRYIFRELLRIFVLATVGLTLILSLGGILRPVQEYGVGPQQVIHILVYFMPITLTFVLPMAALFASALTYGRFASDNELDACRASGISILTLVYPGLALAVFVAIANLMFSFHVMPYFVHLAEISLKADAKQILFRNIQRRGYYSLPPEGRFLIYADHADLKENTLFGIVVVQSTNEGIKRTITSEVTKVQFDPHDKFNEVRLTTYNTKQMGAAVNDFWFHIGTASFAQEFGSLLGDDIKFKRIDEMKRIRANVLLFDPIAKMAGEGHVQLATELLARDIGRRLNAAAGAFYELNGAARSVRFFAAGCELAEPGAIALVAPVTVEEYDGRSGARLRRLICEKAAELHLEDKAGGFDVSLDLRTARVEETGQLLVRCIIPELALPEEMRRALSAGPVQQVAAPESISPLLRGRPSPMLVKQQQALLKKVNKTLMEIKAEVNSRLVFGIGCVPMILIGIALGIIQRGGHLLSAFGASCLPAAVLIVAIISGKNLMKNVGAEGLSGISIMWGGLALLVVLTALLYRRLRRA